MWRCASAGWWSMTSDTSGNLRSRHRPYRDAIICLRVFRWLHHRGGGGESRRKDGRASRLISGKPPA